MSEKSYRKNFGSNLKRFRQAVPLTQEELSEQLNITAQHLSYLETGSRSPSFDVIVAASEVLRVAPADLLLEPSKAYSSRHKEVVTRLSQLTKELSKDDLDRILRVVSNCVQMNREPKKKSNAQKSP